MFKKVLIANRGEIALRVIRACKELGIKTVAIFSEADAASLHVRAADEKICVGPPDAALSYRNIPNVLSAAEITGADAIHPGYGFLSENAHFAEVCESIGIKFIGPTSEHIALLGDKAKARDIVARRGLPVTPGSPGELKSEQGALEAATKIGYPVIIKASAGGGGRGMRVVNKAEDLARAFQAAQAEAKTTFGNDAVYLERYFLEPRHIEVQIVADHRGHIVHLGERDCSIQRRHQKLLEETPSPAVDEKLRREICRVAVEAVKAVHYRNVGTVEFLLDKDHNFFFMEVNTRIQVEHAITEMVTGIDLIKEQIRLADGHSLSFKQQDIKLSGHSLECRINAEDPEKFTPLSRNDHEVQRARRIRRASRFGDGIEHDGRPVLRFDDRQSHHAWTGPAGIHRPHAPSPRRIRDRRHQDDHPAAQAYPQRPRLPKGPRLHHLPRTLPRRLMRPATSSDSHSRFSYHPFCKSLQSRP